MTTKKSAGAQPATAEQPMDVMAKCQAMYDKGMGEDQIIEALAKHEGLSIMRAVTTYKKFLKDAGLTMSKEERVQLISDTIAKFVDEKAKTVELDKAVAAVAVELGISDQAAKGHVARYCKGKGIALPVRQTMSEEDLKPYVDTVVKGREAGDTRAKTVAGMVKQFKLDEKLANRIYYRTVLRWWTSRSSLLRCARSSPRCLTVLPGTTGVPITSPWSSAKPKQHNVAEKGHVFCAPFLCTPVIGGHQQYTSACNPVLICPTSQRGHYVYTQILPF